MKLRTLMLGAAASFAMAPMAMAERGRTALSTSSIGKRLPS